MYIKKTFNFLMVVIAIICSLNISANTLKMAYDADPVSLDPHEQISGATLQLSHTVFDPLIRYNNKDFSFEPRLATHWKLVNKTTMRFFLRKGVQFHSGSEMTAKDVVFTLNRLKKSPDFKGVFTHFTGAEIIDSYTVDIKTVEPFPLLLNNATYIFVMDSEFYSGKDAQGNAKDAIVKHGDAFASRNISGTGPFLVASREQGVKVVFERFEDYWDENSPGNVDEIILTPIKEEPTRVAALLSGDIDFAAPISPASHSQVRNSARTKLVTLDGTRIISFQLNQDRVEAFRDSRVRLAVNYAINQEAIVKKIMRGFGTTAAQFSPRGYLGHNPKLTPRYNIAKAKALLKEAGYEDGFSVSMIAPNNRYVNDEKIAQAVASMLAKVKIKVNLRTMPKAQYWPEFDKRSADMMMIGWHSDTEDSNNFFEFLAACQDLETGQGQYNSGNYCNKAVDRLMDRANREMRAKKRALLMQRIEAMLYKDAAFVPLHWQNLAWGAAKGVNIEPIVNVTNFPYLGDLVIDK